MPEPAVVPMVDLRVRTVPLAFDSKLHDHGRFNEEPVNGGTEEER